MGSQECSLCLERRNCTHHHIIARFFPSSLSQLAEGTLCVIYSFFVGNIITDRTKLPIYHQYFTSPFNRHKKKFEEDSLILSPPSHSLSPLEKNYTIFTYGLLSLAMLFHQGFQILIHMYVCMQYFTAAAKTFYIPMHGPLMLENYRYISC